MSTIRQRFEKYTRNIAPVKISWTDDMIVDFLVKQYNLGNLEAADLLYMHLHNTVFKKLHSSGSGKKDDLDKGAVLSAVSSCSDVPAQIQDEILHDFESGDIDFKIPLLASEEIDDMPF